MLRQLAWSIDRQPLWMCLFAICRRGFSAGLGFVGLGFVRLFGRARDVCGGHGLLVFDGVFCSLTRFQRFYSLLHRLHFFQQGLIDGICLSRWC